MDKVHEQLESPLNTPKMKGDLDAQAKRALSKSARGLKGRQQRIKAQADKAEMDSYKLNRRMKF